MALNFAAGRSTKGCPGCRQYSAIHLISNTWQQNARATPVELCRSKAIELAAICIAANALSAAGNKCPAPELLDGPAKAGVFCAEDNRRALYLPFFDGRGGESGNIRQVYIGNKTWLVAATMPAEAVGGLRLRNFRPELFEKEVILQQLSQ